MRSLCQKHLHAGQGLLHIFTWNLSSSAEGCRAKKFFFNINGFYVLALRCFQVIHSDFNSSTWICLPTVLSLFPRENLLCVSLVVLFFPLQYHLKFNLKKFREFSMIHRQPLFERREPSICITMHIALDQDHSQIRSATLWHSSCRFFRESSTSFQDLAGSNGALAWKYSCFLVKREKGCHLTGICQWSQINWQIKQSQLIGQESNLSPNSSPSRSSGNHSWRLFQKKI